MFLCCGGGYFRVFLNWFLVAVQTEPTVENAYVFVNAESFALLFALWTYPEGVLRKSVLVLLRACQVLLGGAAAPGANPRALVGRYNV